jgi:hypothetical protein
MQKSMVIVGPKTTNPVSAGEQKCENALCDNKATETYTRYGHGDTVACCAACRDGYKVTDMYHMYSDLEVREEVGEKDFRDMWSKPNQYVVLGDPAFHAAYPNTSKWLLDDAMNAKKTLEAFWPYMFGETIPASVVLPTWS